MSGWFLLGNRSRKLGMSMMVPKGPIELHRMPGSADIGKFVMVVYDTHGLCLKSVTIELAKCR